SDAVAMVRIHVRLNLEHKAGHLRLVRIDMARGRLEPARARRELGERADEIAHAEIFERAAEQDRGQMPLAKRGEVERLHRLARELDLARGFLRDAVARQSRDLRIARARYRDLVRVG